MKGIKIVKNSVERATIVIDGYIGDEWWGEGKEQGTALSPAELRQEFAFIAEIKASIIDVKIMSPGGDVHAALVMYDMLKEHKAVVNTMGYGLIASAATIIHQAGNNRYISTYALPLVHKASTCRCGNENDFIAAASDMHTVDTTIKQIYIDNGVEEQAIIDLFEADNGNGKYLSAKEYIDYGFADGYIPENLDEPNKLKNLDKKILRNLNIKLPENMETIDVETPSALDNFLSNPIAFITNIINPKPNPMNQKLQKISDILEASKVKNENGVVSLASADFEKLLDSIESFKTDKNTAENSLSDKTNEFANTLKTEQDAHNATKDLLNAKETDITNAANVLKTEQDAHTATKNTVIEKEDKITELTNLLASKADVTTPKGSDAKISDKTDWSGCPHMLEQD